MSLIREGLQGYDQNECRCLNLVLWTQGPCKRRPVHSTSGGRSVEVQAGPRSSLYQCKLACPGLISHLIIPLKANQCGALAQSRLTALTISDQAIDSLLWSKRLACSWTNES